jgi:hypothetical protein
VDHVFPCFHRTCTGLIGLAPDLFQAGRGNLIEQ